MRMNQVYLKSLAGAFCLVSAISCQKKPVSDNSTTEPSAPATNPTPTKYLYVSTGLCYSGNGITTFTAATASNLIMKINAATGSRESILADYNAYPATGGDTPISVVDWDEDNLLALVGNGASGRIEFVPKSGGTRTNFGLNPGPATTLATTLKAMTKTNDGSLLIARTGFIERVNSSGLRIGAPWVNSNLGATCGTANTLITSVISSSTSRIIATHAAVTASRTLSLAANGATSTSGCAGVQAHHGVTSGNIGFPVAAVYDQAHNKVLVAYAANNTASDRANSIYSYDFDEATGAFSNAQKIYDAFDYPGTYSYLLYGISTMTLDPDSNSLYVATTISNAATAVNYAIEKFTYDASKIGSANSSVLTREGSTPFYSYGIDTKCISSMVVGN